MFSLRKFIHGHVWCNKNNGNRYALTIKEMRSFFKLRYYVPSSNQTRQIVGQRSFTLCMPKVIKRDVELFEVLGLLQAEMGKKLDGKINFSNHEVLIINKVIRWFQSELNFSSFRWKWYIKLNIKEPSDLLYKQEIETKLVEYWTKQTRLSIKQAYPKRVCYVKRTPNKWRAENDYGTMTIERRSNLFSQIVKNLVKGVTENLCHFSKQEIQGFMRGIIAGEGCIETQTKHFRVHIAAVNDEERRIYQIGLRKLEIDSINYPCSQAVIISKRKNHRELLKQNLLTLSPEKHQQFLRMLANYERPVFKVSR